MRCTTALVAIMIAVSVPSIALTQTEKNNNRLLLRTEVDAHELFVERIHLPAGGGFARRNHPGHEIIYVLEGAVELDIGSSSGTVEAGEVFHVEPGTVMSRGNTSSAEPRNLLVFYLQAK